jgi:hypothetical protein
MSKDRGFRSRIAKERGLVTKQRARTQQPASDYICHRGHSAPEQNAHLEW